MPALFLGAWVGSWVISGLSFSGLGQGLLAVFQVYVRNAVANPDHAAIMLFSFMIGGMVGIVSKNGGMRGVVDLISAWANNARRGQVTTALLGIAIFFDDYANTLVVGNTMRRVTDALRISRAKLAFLVDATAAPIVCVAVVTTWVGYEVGLIDGAVARLDGIDEAPYLIYIKSIGYSFYPLLMLVFVFAVATTGRDFGAMYQAEKRARETGDLHGQSAVLEEMEAEGRELEPGDGVPNRAVNAALPVAVLIISVLTGLAVTGSGDTVTEIIGSADSYTALMWASLIAVLTAATLTIAQRILSLEQTVKAWFSGVKMMLFAMIILVLAWSLGEITDHLHTADYLVSLLGDFLPVAAVPAIIFVLAAMTAFATGTSWGTMGILFPIVVPLVWAILNANNMAEPAHMHIMYSSIACVLTGSVWGDHCSPISDTTILSSMASGCDHIEHVATQLPYALFVGAVALLGGTLPAAFGIPWWLLLVVGSAVVITALRFFGKPVD
jgi:Na+/H+ antiporter NhaC